MGRGRGRRAWGERRFWGPRERDRRLGKWEGIHPAVSRNVDGRMVRQYIDF